MKHKKTCMADGGVIPPQRKETAEELLVRMNAKYGVGANSATPQPPPTSASPQQASGAENQPVPAPASSQGIMRSLRQRADETRKSLNYARGGIVAGIVGKGTSTSDEVPIVLAGDEVMTSNGEGIAVLPAKTMRNQDAVKAIESIIQATNAGKKPNGSANKMQSGGVLAGNDALLPERYRHSAGRFDPSKIANLPQIGSPSIYSYAAQTRTQPTAQQLYAPTYDLVARAATGEGMQRAADGTIGLRAQPSVQQTTAGPQQTIAPQQTKQTNASAQARPRENYGNEGVLSAVRSNNTGVGATDGASFDHGNGILSFTQKGFDPTSQQFADGGGAITNTRTGKTMVVAPAATQQTDESKGVDSYGNSTSRAEQMRGELDRLQRENGTGPYSTGPKVASLGSQQEDWDRFNRFSRQATADSLVRSLARGGTQRGIAADIAALQAVNQQLAKDAASQTSLANQANQLAIERQRGQNAIQTSTLSGQNALANTALAGQNALAVEGLRQRSGETAFRSAKLAGEVEDSAIQRAARKGIMDAVNSGDPARMALAQKIGIAAGILHPEKDQYQFLQDPISGQVIGAGNKRTGKVEPVGGANAFATTAEAEAAIKLGKIKIGDVISIAGKPQRVEQ